MRGSWVGRSARQGRHGTGDFTTTNDARGNYSFTGLTRANTERSEPIRVEAKRRNPADVTIVSGTIARETT